VPGPIGLTHYHSARTHGADIFCQPYGVEDDAKPIAMQYDRSRHMTAQALEHTITISFFKVTIFASVNITKSSLAYATKNSSVCLWRCVGRAQTANFFTDLITPVVIPPPHTSPSLRPLNLPPPEQCKLLPTSVPVLSHFEWQLNLYSDAASLRQISSCQFISTFPSWTSPLGHIPPDISPPGQCPSLPI